MSATLVTQRRGQSNAADGSRAGARSRRRWMDRRGRGLTRSEDRDHAGAVENHHRQQHQNRTAGSTARSIPPGLRARCIYVSPAKPRHVGLSPGSISRAGFFSSPKMGGCWPVMRRRPSYKTGPIPTAHTDPTSRRSGGQGPAACWRRCSGSTIRCSIISTSRRGSGATPDIIGRWESPDCGRAAVSVTTIDRALRPGDGAARGDAGKRSPTIRGQPPPVTGDGQFAR